MEEKKNWMKKLKCGQRVKKLKLKKKLTSNKNQY